MAELLQHPFQCLAVAKPPGADHEFLVAACGPKLVSTSLAKDPAVFEWPEEHQETSSTRDGNDEERPAKKQKTSSATPRISSIINLTVSPSNQHAVLVTDDKIVRVFDIHADGTMTELSQRAMPKRPCAVDILPDNATILCGDKFGDVYSLPLLPDETVTAPDAIAGAESEQHENKQAPVFTPSATNTTVHTKRNRKALEAQLKQRNLTPKSKEPLKFEHKLLLGHVSMLTDLKFAAREVDGKQRNYIVTADRDEHIRVSRGPPQSHIIEGYCLDHTDYINKICLVPSTNLVVSGGGDSWIGVWDWPSVTLRRKLEAFDTLQTFMQELTAQSGESTASIDSINVSGIWVVPMEFGNAIDSALLVASESVPAILACPISDLLNENASFQPIAFSDGPILDVVCSGNTTFVTSDSRQTSGPPRIKSQRLVRDAAGHINLVPDEEFSDSVQRLNGLPAALTDEKTLEGLLYGVANLRKRGYQTDETGIEVDDGPANGDQGDVQAQGGD